MTNATRLLIVLAAVLLAAAFDTGRSHADPPPLIEPMIWQLDLDYPESTPSDASLPIHTVYIKTHDGTDWMSTYDDHPLAVAGPATIQSLINIYGNQGIEVAAWFVPKGADYDTQVAMAVQVIDSGVTALYADLEPFAGFCYKDCAPLATNFWARVRQERPNARLGVIYDPRPWWWDASATSLWFANADVAMPMCYWESYAGQGSFGDPAGCVTQAKADLAKLSPNRALEYLPILQGDSTPDRVQKALDASIRSGAARASLWRRGVVSNDVWSMIANYQAPSGPHCAVLLIDGCVIRDATQGTVYLVQGGAKFGFPSWETFVAMGQTERDIQVLPDGVVDGLPHVPVDGTHLQEFGGDIVYVVYGGAKFVIAAGEALATGASNARTVPPGGTGQIPFVPPDFTRFREQSAEDKYVVLHGGRIQLDDAAERALADMGFSDEPLYVVPDGGLEQIPVLQVKRGDVDCDGAVGIEDVLGVLKSNIGIANPSPCISVTGDVTCDGFSLTDDALRLLLFFAESPMQPVADCAPIGEPQPAILSQSDVPTSSPVSASTE